MTGNGFKISLRASGFFILAAIIYIISLVAFCSWSYAEEPQLMIRHSTPLPAADNLQKADNTDLLRRLAAYKVVTGIFLLAMAIPLAVLSNRVPLKASRKLEELNLRLQQKIEFQNIREKELNSAINDLKRLNAVSIGREGRMLELKGEVNELLEQLHQHKRYNTDY